MPKYFYTSDKYCAFFATNMLFALEIVFFTCGSLELQEEENNREEGREEGRRGGEKRGAKREKSRYKSLLQG